MATFFTDETFRFLLDLQRHNERDWFKRHQARYEESVREPARAFVRAMEGKIEKISPSFVASDKKVGGSLMRPQRDTRFSKDKSPYKLNVGIQFRHVAGKDVHAPGLYVHLEPGSVFLGAGLWHPDSPSLSGIRAAIDEHSARWKRVSRGKRFTDQWELGGDSLKRPPRGYSADHPLIEDLLRKDHIAVTTLDESDATSARFDDLCGRAFARTKDYLAFLCEAIDVSF